jgi:hypothetical protein
MQKKASKSCWRSRWKSCGRSDTRCNDFP